MDTRASRLAWMAGLAFALVLAVAAAQEPSVNSAWAMARASRGTVIIPASSHKQQVPAGHRFVAHTNVRIMMPAGFDPKEAPPYADFGYETPASLACHYGLVTEPAGVAPACNPNSTTINVTGGSWRIAIVDAYAYPTASADLGAYSAQFGLPLAAGQFTVVPATTSASTCTSIPSDPTGGGWEVEQALDSQMAHAMAPGATLFLVEACSNEDSDLQQAILVASNLVRCKSTQIDPTTRALGTCPASSQGRGEVSMSWGGGEYYPEAGADNCSFLDDSCFTEASVVYVASVGDSPGVEYPSASPNVVAAGGTTLRRNPTTFDYEAEAPWVDTGGGPSAVEPRPAFQFPVASVVGAYRGVPDVSFDADPNTGPWIYFEGEWGPVGGTSVSAPSLAGIINKAGNFAASSQAELTVMYSATSGFRDIKSGFCGPYMGLSGTTGWDFCTGLGVVSGYAGK